MGGCGSKSAPESAGQPGSSQPPDEKDLRAVIVWSASGIKNDLQSGRPYVIVRLDEAERPWNEKARSNGRRSEPASWPEPEWKLGFAVSLANLKTPELHVRLYTAHFFGDPENFVDEVRVPVSKLEAAKSAEPQTLEFAKAGGALKVSFGPVKILEEKGIKRSQLYEKLAPIGVEKQVKVDDVTGDGPFLVGKEPLPKTIRGIFWLTDQENLSALATFGGPNKDGGGCSVGKLDGNEARIRVSGDRVWAAAEPYRLLDRLDFVYHFLFDNPDNPTRVQIYPETIALGQIITNQWLLDFEARLVPEGDPEYPGSVIWKRESWVFGKDGKGGFKIQDYLLVQVIGEDGKRIEPAWSKFVEYKNSSKAGSTPGILHYHTSA